MLEVRGLEVHYGGICAVRGVDLDVAAGEKVALIGANGAGKTSTLKAIARMLPARGSVKLGGEAIEHAPPHLLVRKGLALVPEGRGVFARLSVLENLEMGAYVRDDKAAIAADIERVFGLLPRLKERAGQTAGTLSGGEQQMVAIGRALMSRPRILLLDEPSMGLSPIMVDTVFDVIREVAREGVTLLLVEQNARLALSLCDRGCVMDGGEITLSAPAAELLDNPAVRAAYLGE
ncbi:MAG: ABC transporter ATP-binding protein [Methyloversatilis sp.]|jgi:branched-chain amino acid transport system ATP-binding protein|uniref:ABC transporter ATP-binding protein n=1 Tax=Methyloversatilis TaxID=378210 RepID=UPI000DAF7900|nr:ABC transporter ATP-binding protein [Methyloversatilis sp.]MCR6668101.1 ABC transporter ATP-binding protein [Methyloversatilis sp.]PZU55061.1 MAG: ABC transporter ATP-binding protein [Thauera sp.]